MSDPGSNGALTALVVMTLLFLPLAFFSICTALKNVDLKLAMSGMLTLFDIWKHSKEKPLWELEKKYLTREEQERETVFVKKRSDNQFIMDMEALRKEFKL